MDSQITRLLESSSPQDRKKAIKMMANVGGQEVLRTLAWLYKNDNDPEVRQLAIDAGKAIKKQETAEFAALLPSIDEHRKTSQNTRVKPVIDVVEEEPEEDSHNIQTVFVSAAREAQAVDLLENSAVALKNGERDKALDLLIKAFKLNPNYRLDNHAMSMALDITAMDRGDFYDLLEDDARIRGAIRGLRGKDDKKKKNSGQVKSKNIFSIGVFGTKEKDENGDALWSTVMIDLGFCFVVLASIIMIFMIILIQTYQGAATNVLQGCPSCSPTELLRLRDLVRETRSIFVITPLQGGLLGVVWAVSFVFQLLVYYGVLHTALHYYLSPEGTFRGMLHYCVRFDMALYCILIVLFGGAILLILRDIYDPHFYSLYKDGGRPLWQHLLNLGGIVGVVGGLWSFWRITKYYNEGCFQVGCVMMIAEVIASALLSGIASGLLDTFFSGLVDLILKR
jgi:hypothetical protein